MSRFKGWDWRELIEVWDIKVDEKEHPEFDGEEPDVDKMELYQTEDGKHVSWSDWWEAEASEEYKKHIEEFGKVSDFNEKSDMDTIRKYIWDSMNNGTKKQVSGDLREFITALAEQSNGHDYCYPVWNALLEIDNEHTLFQFVDTLLPMMWS